MRRGRRALAVSLLCLTPLLSTVDAAGASAPAVSAGTFTKIYDPSVGEAGPWYINDHTFVRDRHGQWHMFGITHPEPADPEHEIVFAHATAPALMGPWTKQPFALTVSPNYGETHLWAPYVLTVGDTYYMFYAGGGYDLTSTEINLATSRDLFHWRREPSGPLFRDGFEARDPFVLRIDGRWVMYYDGTSDPHFGDHVVLYRTSYDLRHWSDRAVAFTSPEPQGTGAGSTESPYVVRHGGHWYLFTGPHPDYVGTEVYVSDDPFHFDAANLAGHIAAHAAEVVQDHGSWYVSAAGWGQGGLYLAPLHWSS